MDITLTILGYEIAKIKINTEAPLAGLPEVGVIETVVDGVSDWWVRRMLKRSSR
jgi:hypothetical protein